MIKANELRVGNKILSIFNNIETVRMILGHEGYKDNADVHEIFKHHIGVEENRNQYNLAEIKPIPVDEKWCLDFGFEKKDSYLFPGFEIETVPDTNLSNRHTLSLNIKNGEQFIRITEEDNGSDSFPQVVIWDESVSGHPMYVHQVQNIYFMLTGKELTLKQQ